MFLRRGFWSKAGRVPHKRAVRPRLEVLESRQLLYSTLGAQWIHPERITFSFAPDGTNLGGVSSNLFAAMAADGLSTQQWQDAIRAAAAIWEEVANINLVQVADNGTPFGGGDYEQGDPGMGDIRIVGAALGGNYLGVTASPPPINGSSVAGDIILATDLNWRTNGTTFDLETVAIHEFGHALGMDHSTISQAVMHATYDGVKQSLNTDDVQGIGSIYGARQADAFDIGTGNNTYATATVLNSVPGFSYNTNAQATLTGLQISTRTDEDWFSVTVPSNTTGTFQATMQSTGLSVLAPRVMIYNSSLRPVAASFSSAFGDTVTATVPGVQAGQTYYIRLARGSAQYYNDIGAYALQLNFGSASMSPVAPPSTQILVQPNQGGGQSALSIGGQQNGPETPSYTSHGFGYGFASEILAALGSRFGWNPADPPGRNRFLSSVPSLAIDESRGLWKLGSLTAYGDALSISPPASTGSDTGSAGEASTFQSASSPNLTLAFPPDPDDASGKPDSNRLRGR
ncbi:MAG TPA: matrixin family metalloprotease [Isosphaeraceae bacterium]|nr:matrixin family metalloprotease [Isosphaeraceae bacterium]